MFDDMAAEGGTRNFAKDFNHMKRSLREHQWQYDSLLNMFMEARGMVKLLKFRSEGEGTTCGIVDIHWDLLQMDHMNLRSLILNFLSLIFYLQLL